MSNIYKRDKQKEINIHTPST